MNRKQMIEDITSTLQYNFNGWYVGGHHTARICSIVGVKYGDGTLIKAISEASEKTLMEVYADLEKQIEYVKKHPIAKCPCCGQMRPI